MALTVTLAICFMVKLHVTVFFFKLQFFYIIYLYIYPPDSQESDGGTNT